MDSRTSCKLILVAQSLTWRLQTWTVCSASC